MNNRAVIVINMLLPFQKKVTRERQNSSDCDKTINYSCNSQKVDIGTIVSNACKQFTNHSTSKPDGKTKQNLLKVWQSVNHENTDKQENDYHTSSYWPLLVLGGIL